MISDNIKRLNSTLPEGVRLVAVSKFHPKGAILEAYEAGQRRFGENRVQELVGKIPELPKDIEWHFIGHLQTNKAKQIVGKVSLIESVDSLKLLELINKLSEEQNIVSDILLQVHVAEEETKFGFSPEELKELFERGEHLRMKNVRICGIMGMATNTADSERVRNDFKRIKSTFDEIKTGFPEVGERFQTVSMGMSGDWPIAAEEGSNLIRVGTAIFGEREY